MKSHASTPPSQRLLTKSEAAQILNISVRTLDDWCAAGSIACIKRPNYVRFLPSDLDAFIQRHRRAENPHRTLRRRPRQHRAEQQGQSNLEGIQD
jgi:excisionase family DNA binding protein